MKTHYVLENLKSFIKQNPADRSNKWLKTISEDIVSAVKFDFGEIDDFMGEASMLDTMPSLPFPLIYCELIDTDTTVTLGLLLKQEGSYVRAVIFGNRGAGTAIAPIPGEFLCCQGVGKIDYILAESHGESLSDDEIFIDDGAAIDLFFGYVAIMNCSNITYTDHEASKLTNKRREQKRKPPIFTYKTLHIFGGERDCKKTGDKGSHGSPRVHLRRGHIRRFSSGKTTWVQACVVGDKNKGVVHKDYMVH